MYSALSSSGGDALHTQNMNHNVLSQSIRDVESLCHLSNANTTIFELNFLHFFDVIVVNTLRTALCAFRFAKNEISRDLYAMC